MKVLYSLLFGIWYLLSLFPLRILYIFSDILYLIVCYIVRYRHRIIWKNLCESLPEKPEKELRKIEKGFYHWFCDYIVETIKLMTMSSKQLKKHIIFTGTDKIDRYVEQELSCAIYLGHYGEWEWITSLPLWIGKKAQCMQIYHPLENKHFDDLFKYVRERQGALCVPMAETLRRVVAYQQKKQPIVMGYISDQVPFWNNIHHWYNFLHHDTPVLTGSEKVIKVANQVTFYGDVSRIKRGYYRCEIRLLTDNPKSVPDYGITDMYFEELEKTIRRDPSLYLWSHNRWKRTHEEYNMRYDKTTGRVDLGSLEEIEKRKKHQAHTT